ncbi:phosphotransferase family protein [Aspergillus insuetus]
MSYRTLKGTFQPAHLSAKPSDLFGYTLGRWLVDEEVQRRQRSVRFSLDNPCRLAAAHFGDATRCVRVVKQEGNFNKAFLLTMDDGNEVVVRLPCPNAGPPSLNTASEVATVQFCIAVQASICVPRMFQRGADASNLMGAEFILMEKISGVPLVINRVVQLEIELANMALPAYSGLCLCESNGASLPEYALSAIERVFARITNAESIGGYRSLLERLRMVLPTLSHHKRVTDDSDPVLWHTDLHLGNIFVSPDKPSTIEGIIDWQSCHSAPLFLQAQFPDFLAPPKKYTFGPEVPALPDHFESLSPEEQHYARRGKELASRSKYYKMSCPTHSSHVYEAMSLDRRLLEPFVCAQLGIQGSLVPLREWLIQVSKNWSSLDLPEDCPYQITEEERRKHAEQELQYEDRLQTDNSGWIFHDRWEMTDRRNRELYEMYIDPMSEELDLEAARRNWPFPPLED